jgi:hypothetical protein
MPSRFTFALLKYLMCFLLAGCSGQQAYEGIKARSQNECYRLPDTQREKCLEAADVSYEEYQRRREETRTSN